MELRQLRAFVVLAETLHFGRAADRLMVTPSALSQQIRRLEREVGGPLLERTSRAAVLTPAGRAMLEHAARIVRQADAALADVRGHADGTAGRLAVGLLDEGAAELNGPILRMFRAARPAVRVDVRTLPYGDHVSALQRGEVDVVLGPSVAAAAGAVDVHPLFVDGRLAALPVTHPLAEAEVVAAAALLDDAVPVTPGLPQTMLDHFLLAHLRNGDGPRSCRPGGGLLPDVLHQIAVDGAVATVTSAVQRFFPYPGVVYRPVPDAPDTDISVLTRVSDPRSDPPRPLVTAFTAAARRTTVDLIDLVPGARAAPIS